MEKEIWKPIPNFSKYEASNLGRLRSLNYKRTGKVVVLKTSKSKDGYLKTMIKNDDNIYKSWSVHKFVMLTFKGERKKGEEVNHINGIKTDNRAVNLEYVTHSENVQHSFDIGLQKPKRGELNGMSKLNRKQVEYIREAKKTKGRYWGRNELAKKFNVSAKHLQDIANNDKLWM